MSLAGFAFLLALVGALIVVAVIVTLIVVFVNRVGWNASNAKIDADADAFRKTTFFRLVLRPASRIGGGLFWGGLIVGFLALIVHA